MANSTLVPNTSTDELSQTSFATQHKEVIDESKRGDPSIGKKSDFTTSGMVSFREKLLAEGISEKAALLITDARKGGTKNHYESAWRKWGSWCHGRNLDPFRGDVNPVLEFLTEIFHDGLKYNTIAGYRSAISAYHDPIGPYKVGQHPRVSELMTVFSIIGCLNQNMVLSGMLILS